MKTFNVPMTVLGRPWF